MKDMTLIASVLLMSVALPVGYYCAQRPVDEATIERLSARNAALEEAAAALQPTMREAADVHLIEFIRGNSSFISDQDLKWGSDHLVKLAEEKF